MAGARLLVLLVAGAREPIEDTSGRLRWRVGTHCVPVDRSEWWLYRQGQAGYDSMATTTGLTVADVTPGALAAARRYLEADTTRGEVGADSALDILRRIGVVLPDERLSQAGALMLCAADRTFKNVWVLSPAALALLESEHRPAGRRRALVPYRRPDATAATDVARAWFGEHDRITSGDYAKLTGLTQQGALGQLDRLVADGLAVRGQGRGRNAHFLPGPGLDSPHP